MIDATIRDATALEELKQIHIANVLWELGWVKIGENHRGDMLFELPAWDKIVTVPKIPHGASYANVIRAVSEIEGKSELDVFLFMGGELGVYESFRTQPLTTPGDGIS